MFLLLARLARDFGISEDTVRGWHCLVLLRRGHDVLGEEAMSQVGILDFRSRRISAELIAILFCFFTAGLHAELALLLLHCQGLCTETLLLIS